MENSTINRAVPIKVPWMVSPSVSDLKLIALENEETSIHVAVSMLPQEDEGGGDLLLAGGRVEIFFDSGRWIRTSPSYSDREVVPPNQFDMSLVNPGPISNQIEYLRSFVSKWRTLNHCPDSGFYEIQDSSWITESDTARYNCRHYLIVGSDVFIEILATAFIWKWSTE